MQGVFPGQTHLNHGNDEARREGCRSDGAWSFFYNRFYKDAVPTELLQRTRFQRQRRGIFVAADILPRFTGKMALVPVVRVNSCESVVKEFFTKHENSAQIISVKNITLSAEEQLIEQARKQASRESRTLNDLFRNWLRSYVNQPLAADQFDAIHDSLSHVRSGKTFTREELNER